MEAAYLKIVSFCLWGPDNKYNVGAIKNAQLAQEIYPGWECWFYCYGNTDTKTMLILSQMPNCKVIFSDKIGDWRAMLDRFQAIDNPEVEVMISRDCDSRLSLREKAAVDEWLASDELVHSMRDHPHHSVPMLGGMFGLKKGIINNITNEIKEFLSEPLKDGGNYWQIDQQFLANYVFTSTRRIMTHDDGFWTHFWGGKPFPRPRSGLEFVGQVFDENDNTVAEHQNALVQYLNNK